MRKLKHVKLFENFLINEGNMRGGGPEKVLYIYGNAEENAIGKKVMHSETSYYYKEINQNKDGELINRMINFVKKSCDEKGYKEFSKEIQQKTYSMDYFTNTHSGAILFVRFLDRNNKPIITNVPNFIVDGWILPSFYGEGEYKFGPGTTKGFIDETELELLVKSQNIPDANGLSKALKEFRHNISDITSKGIITTKDQ